MKMLNRRGFGLLPLFLVAFFFASAQEVDYNKIILPSAQANVDFAEKLVLLAWENYPRNKAIQAQVAVAAEEVKIRRWDWLNRIQVTGNMNEYTITGQEVVPGTGRNLFYPRYNFSISLSPGMLIAMPAATRQAKENLKIAKYAVDEQMLLMRNTVMQLYQDYLLSKELLELETRAMESSTTQFELQEERFKQGKVLLEDYTATVDIHLAQQRALLQAKANYMKAELALEELIGLQLESVR